MGKGFGIMPGTQVMPSACPWLFCALPILSSKKESFGANQPQTLPTESGQRRSASCQYVCIGAGKQGQSHLTVAHGLHAMSLNLWPPVFSYTGPLLGAAAVFSSQENLVVLGASLWPDSPVDRSSHMTQFWPRRWRSEF